MSAPRQDEFGGGIFRSPRAPAGSVYDCVNGLIDDELAIYRRGGVSYRTNASVGATLVGIADAVLAPGARTLFWTDTQMWALSPDDLTPDSIGLSPAAPPARFGKAFGGNGALILPSSTPGKALAYGGSKKATYAVGTASWTAASKTITGVGTAWLANADEGGLFLGAAGGVWVGGAVERVVSNTQLVLRDPVAVTGSGAYQVTAVIEIDPVPIGTIPAGTSFVAAVGSPARLVVTAGGRAYFSAAGQMGSFDPTDFHELPPPATIIGADAVRDMLVLFATNGVWVVSNMSLDLTSSTGDPQQKLEQITKDVILWGNPGVAGFSTYAGVQGWAGQFIVPALDDVYVVGVGVESSPIPVSRGIRSLYRGYVAAGYKPGLATVYQGHYILPIISGVTPVDTLVCRLDQRDSRGQLRPGWTRLSGYGRGSAFTGRARPTSAPSLVGLNGTGRVIDSTSWFTPDAAHKQDADGTTHALDVIENDVEFANRSTTQKVDLLYELTDAAADNPTIVGSWASGAEGSAWTPLSGSAAENDGRVPERWRLIKRVRNVRFRWQTVGPAAVARIRGRVLYVRDSNRP